MHGCTYTSGCVTSLSNGRVAELHSLNMQHVELWLALARLEDYDQAKKVINRAIKVSSFFCPASICSFQQLCGAWLAEHCGCSLPLHVYIGPAACA